MSDKSDFAGLTRLGPGEPLSADDWSFQGSNIDIIDALTRLGAVQHRHDGHAALAPPTADSVLSLLTTGGTIPADTPLYVCHTFLDADGGETTPDPAPPMVTTAAGLVTPDDSPGLIVDHVTGDLLAGTYTYAVTVVDGLGGETKIGPFRQATIPPGSVHSKITVSGLAALVTASAGTGWRLWRRVNGGQLGLINSGTTDTLIDDGSFGVDCTVSPPLSTGTTHATNVLHVALPAEEPAGAAQIRVYVSTDGAFPSPCLMGTYPIADGGTTKSYTTLSTALDGEPPETSRAFPGASVIDADTQVINLRVKAPVANVAALPTTGNRDGDMRVALDTHILYVWYAGSTSWAAISGGGGGGAHVIAEEGAGLPPRTTLNFVGASVTVTDDSGDDETTVTIDGGAGHAIEDEGTPLTTRAKLNFVGDGVAVTDDSGDDATIVTITGAGGGGGAGMTYQELLEEQGAIAFFPLSEDETDLIGAYSSTVVGGLTFGGTDGPFGDAATTFDGTDDEIDIDTALCTDIGGEATITGWFRLDDASSQGCMVNLGSDSTGLGVGIGGATWVSPDEYIVGLTYGHGWTTASGDHLMQFQQDRWMHFAIVSDDVQTYIVLGGRVSTAGAAMTAPDTVRASIGGAGTTLIEGSLANIAFFPRRLTLGEIIEQATYDPSSGGGGGGGGGGGLESRDDVVYSPGAMTEDDVVTAAIALPKGYNLYSLESTIDARVELYATAGARTADASRPSGTPPSVPSHGIVIDVEADAATPLIFTPAVAGWNGDSTPADLAYVRVTALETGTCAVTFTAVRTEA